MFSVWKDDCSSEKEQKNDIFGKENQADQRKKKERRRQE